MEHCSALCTVIMTIRTMACVMILILPSLIISPVPYKMIYKKKTRLDGNDGDINILAAFLHFLAPNRSLIASLLFVLLRFRPEFLRYFVLLYFRYFSL